MDTLLGRPHPHLITSHSFPERPTLSLCLITPRPHPLPRHAHTHLGLKPMLYFLPNKFQIYFLWTDPKFFSVVQPKIPSSPELRSANLVGCSGQQHPAAERASDFRSVQMFFVGTLWWSQNKVCVWWVGVLWTGKGKGLGTGIAF